MKDAYYFSHDSNAKDDPKSVKLIEQLGPEGYGIFWILVETLRDQPDYSYPVELLPALARRYNTTSEKMKAVVVGYELFILTEDGRFFSESLNERMKSLENKREINRQKALKRWNKPASIPLQCHSNATAMPIDASKVKESKVKYSKRKESKNNKSNSSDSHESSDFQSVVKEYFELFEQHYQSKPLFGKSDGNIIKNLLSSQQPHVILEKLRKFMRDEFWFTRDGSGRDLKKFRAHYNEIVVKDGPPTTGSGYLNVCLASSDARKFKFNILTENEKQVVIEKVGLVELQAEGLL